MEWSYFHWFNPFLQNFYEYELKVNFMTVAYIIYVAFFASFPFEILPYGMQGRVNLRVEFTWMGTTKFD